VACETIRTFLRFFSESKKVPFDVFCVVAHFFSNTAFSCVNYGWFCSHSHQRLQSLVHAFISRPLDCCNALLYGIADCQLLQNAAASEDITGLRRTEHVLSTCWHMQWPWDAFTYQPPTGLVVHCLSSTIPATAATSSSMSLAMSRPSKWYKTHPIILSLWNHHK